MQNNLPTEAIEPRRFCRIWLVLMGYAINIPSLCSINPLYNRLMGLRFRALQYLSSH
ncbi:hypothetical protein F7734_15615 [Scytonema sp. UIC 10036]|uniref:Mo-dependent nitrogenase C-terminal domain-containing protein n=1 Tax=Scytonema sp. UIC 10036 TaxID=2304196 RepID=UPI0012DA91AB|nr:Mo-dependent nitrogenase C-terminal domain-containing protein [Scytonema sp. UIC 10036]MUG93767.1 hypothetical protein [Scytonema sp. UIC 10036]